MYVLLSLHNTYANPNLRLNRLPEGQHHPQASLPPSKLLCRQLRPPKSAAARLAPLKYGADSPLTLAGHTDVVIVSAGFRLLSTMTKQVLVLRLAMSSQRSAARVIPITAMNHSHQRLLLYPDPI